MKRFEYVNKKKNICDYFIDHVEGIDYTGMNLWEIVALLNSLSEPIPEHVCGNCKCYTALQFHAETGRCRRYNTITQLRTKCLNLKDYVCNQCMVKECMDRKENDTYERKDNKRTES